MVQLWTKSKPSREVVYPVVSGCGITTGFITYREAVMSESESPNRIRGVLSPVITPFDRDLRPDAKRLDPPLSLVAG